MDRWELTFANGYTASIVAYKDAPYEIAVIRDGKLDYTTPITNDVLGHLSASAALDALVNIAALPKHKE